MEKMQQKIRENARDATAALARQSAQRSSEQLRRQQDEAANRQREYYQREQERITRSIWTLVGRAT